jgi:phospholipid transport system substrate-binding protein
MKRLVMTMLGLALLLGTVVPVRAGAPTDQVRDYTERVIKILEDPALKGQDRRSAIRKVATEVFDISETAKRALGRHWQGRSPSEQEEFVQLFADLLENTYIARIDEYGGERVKYVAETVEGDLATVRARIVTRKNTEIPVDARMLRRSDRWYIYDILIENVSLISNYRAQFDRIIRTASYDELVRRLRSRQFEAPERETKPRG